MSIDPTGIVANVAAGIATHHVVNATEQSSEPSSDDYIRAIHDIVHSLYVYLINTAQVTKDVREFVQVYKSGLGTPFRPVRNRETHEYMYCRVKSPVAVTLDVTASSFGSYTIALQAGVWQTLDDPIGSDYICDASFASPFVTLWVNYTDKEIS